MHQINKPHKRSIKKILFKATLSVFSALTLVCTETNPTSFFSKSQSDITAYAAKSPEFGVILRDDNTYAIQKPFSLEGTTYPKILTIPSTYDGKQINSIGNYGFSNNSEVEKIIISEGITKIERQAFENCPNLKNVVLPKSLKTIEYGAFNSCTSLKEIILPEGIKKIEDSTFSYCSSLQSIKLPDSVESIGESAFSYCTALETINFPKSLKSIGYYAFEHDTKLNFDISPENRYFAEQDGALYNKDFSKLLMFPAAFEKSITLPDTLKTIGSYSLNDYCDSTLYIPDSVEVIEDNALDSYKLYQIEISPTNTHFVNDENMFLTADRSTLVRLFYSYSESDTLTIPDEVTRILGGAVRNCSYAHIDLPNVEYIGDHAFASYNLISINAPKLKKLGASNFNFSSIPSFSFPELEEIGADAFYGNSSLTTFDAPKLKVIGDRAFSNCTSLSDFDFSGTVSIGEHAFSHTGLKDINCPATEISECAFYHCDNLETISLPKAKILGHESFSSCVKLKSINLPKVTSIGDYAFSQCSSITTVTAPKVQSIGEYAFRDCSSIKKISFPELKMLGNWALEHCSALEEISLPKLSEVGWAPLNGCNNLHAIETNADFTASDRVYLFYDYEGKKPVITDLTIVGTKQYKDISNLLFVLDMNSGTVHVEAKADQYAVAKIRGISVTDSNAVSLNLKSIYMLKGDRKTALRLVNTNPKKTVTFASANTKIAKVDKNGDVEAVGVGSTTITAKYNGKTYKCPITVYARTVENRPKQLDKQYGLWNLSDYEVVNALFEWIRFNCKYDYTYTKAYADGILLDYTGICNSYMLATGVLLDYFKIPNENIIGDELFHGWNYIKIGNDWFQWDSTWSKFLSTDKDIHVNGQAAGYDKSGHFGFVSKYVCNQTNPNTKYSSRNPKSKAASVKPALQSLTAGKEGVKKYKNFYYTENADGTLTIVEYVGTAKNVEVPSKINGKKVTKIGMHAFCFSRNMQKIALPSTLVEIEEDAFSYCTALKEIKIPDSVKKMGGYQFYGCTALTKVVLSKNLTEISERTFKHCTKLKEIVIPDKVKTIGDHAFAWSALEKITLPASLKTVGDGAFVAWPSVKTVIFKGTSKQWKAIKDNDKYYLSQAKVTYKK